MIKNHKRYLLLLSAICVFSISSAGCAAGETGKSTSSSEAETTSLNSSSEGAFDTDLVDTEEAEKAGNKSKLTSGSYFNSIDGCAVILDADGYAFYNEVDSGVQVSPCSTFKIVSTLMGLQNQVITSEDSTMGYDGTQYPMEAWNSDLSLSEAFQNSCVWYFRKVIDQVGEEETKAELEELGYGNCDVSEWQGNLSNPIPELNGFWLESSLKISPLEQVNLLQKIFEGKTRYSEKTVEVLKQVMLIETNEYGSFYGKTGTGIKHNAWFVGMLEREDSNLYFAVYIEDENVDEVNGSKAKEIAMNTVKDYCDTN